MEPNIWTQLFVRVVDFLFSRFASLKNPNDQINGGELPSVPANDAVLISTSKSATILEVVLTRMEKTGDSIFGTIQVGDFNCLSLENLALSIPAGRYEIEIYDSPHNGHPVPRLKNVPGRTEIEMHCGNTFHDSKGCIIVGDLRIGDTLENSRVAFDRFFPLIQAAIETGQVWIEVIDVDTSRH